MAENFIVQKRPANGVLNGFYYRVVDVSTGQGVNQNFTHAELAESHCRHLNEVHLEGELTQPVEEA